jgi:NADP-dependent 3-hydroxy acid dehydrogenase YdfG
MGGFGLELAEWLVKCGAEKILLVGRNGIKNLYQKQQFEKYNNIFEYVYGDVTNEDHIKKIFTQYDIKGVWHLAMTLRDKLYNNINDEDWNTVVDTKYKGAILLDTYCPINALFVVWSSVSSLFGNPGQTSYAYSNYMIEEICRKRRENNKHGIAINWGPIDNIGYLNNDLNKLNNWIFKMQNIDSCLHDLHTILRINKNVTCYKIQETDNNSNK